MSDQYAELRSDISDVADALAKYSQAVGHATDAQDTAIRRLWDDIAALRDDLHAVVNRVESVARVVFDDGQHSVKVLGEGEQQ